MNLLIALVPAAALAAGNYLVAAQPACISCTAWLVGGPFVLALLLLAVVPRVAAPEAPSPVAAVPAADAAEQGALGLLAALQADGRLVDFLEEDLGPYGDEQVGGAARDIHDGCRRALRDRVTLEPVLAGAEGESVTVEAGFDPAAIRLTGNVTGAPPFRGVLRHAGWRVKTVTLPARRGQNPHVIAPAEVEIS
ncbi:MAG: DUF2760 domain-containing protein [Deltaproteobacteria bacterium]|nr:MAG: DUF2760 domain-containing protein [Deltaproteobacteria bacterium]TMA62578.1 MAG: DUF2760 domain-containing protein [Deltaproteobacteria bacterium]TMB46119.1 MAG: DUF2760 domain-containing protein [Deltaproteobacteria bacterium]